MRLKSFTGGHHILNPLTTGQQGKSAQKDDLKLLFESTFAPAKEDPDEQTEL